jgi:signal transduction histidine kinase/ActR/RegA family two-component response regulator
MPDSMMADRGRVWILEDSTLEAELARRALTPTQDVELFADGSVLLERASSGSPPDLVVLDWHLPGISGVEVCRVLRASHDAMRLPIVMLTSSGHKDDILEALAAGANDYVTKPYDVAEVIARVSTLVRTSRLHRTQLRRTRQLSLSAEVGAALTTGKDLREVAVRSVEALVRHVDATVVEIWTGGTDELSLLAKHEEAPRLPEAFVRPLADRRVPLLVDDPTSVPELAALRLTAFVALPLIVRGEVLGVLALGTSQPIVDAAPVLAGIADLLALGIGRARVEEERIALLVRERSARADAEAANRSKDDFLATVSHELRTPLNAISGWTSLLKAGDLDAQKTTRALDVIERSVRSQSRLIDDLLDISRIISGTLRVNFGSVDVAEVAEMALESVRVASDAKGLTLDASIDTKAGRVEGDADRIQQIIWNLLSNAIKFTPRGGRVALALSRDDHGVVIDVTDSGQGIASEFVPYVFERFKQADGTATRSKGGLGLGLAIVKSLTELHGGSAEAHSDGLGQGSRFRVALPTPESASRSSRFTGIGPFLATRGTMSDRPREVEGLRVLVVDDEEDSRELLRSLLESYAAEVSTASSAAEGFKAVTTQRFDVLLSDIAMPEEDGFSFIKRVRELSREDGGRIPAVALTAYARLEDRTRALRAGFNSHVAKPLDVAELLAVLVSFANR